LTRSGKNSLPTPPFLLAPAGAVLARFALPPPVDEGPSGPPLGT